MNINTLYICIYNETQKEMIFFLHFPLMRAEREGAKQQNYLIKKSDYFAD